MNPSNPNTNPIYHLAPPEPSLTEDDVRIIIGQQLRTFTEPTKVSRGFFASANFVSGSTGWQLLPNGNFEANAGTFRGTLTGNSLNIPDSVTVNSFHVDTTGNSWWGATTLGSATAKVLNTGAGTFSSMTITGGAISGTPISGIPNNTSTDISLLTFTQNLAFTSTNATQVNWTSGTINLANGRTFAISAGNTGTMSASTYIYLDSVASLIVLQTTTTYSTAIGANKILIATAQNNATAASVVSFGGGQPVLDGAGNIAALSITAGSIAASTITAGKMNVTQLSAISANLGSITAGSITVVTGGNTVAITPGSTNAIISGPTGAPTFILTATGALTATSATISGYVVSSKGSFGGDGSDGALSITSGTTTIDLASATYVIKNYTSISITGTGKLAFINPNTSGTAIILKSQGAVTLTSSSAPMIDASKLGGGGGGARTTGNTGNALFGSTGGGVATNNATGGAGGAGPSPSFRNDLSGKIVKFSCGAGGAGGDESSASGGNGGGVLIIESFGAFNFTTASGISVAAENGHNATTNASGGGGGGGGTCVILYNVLTANSGTITIAGGAGGAPSGASTNGAGGGGGGAGGAGTAGGNGNNTGGVGGVGLSMVAINNCFS